MDLDNDMSMDIDDMRLRPMPSSSGIIQLKEKLHSKIAQLRNRSGGEAGTKDELLEERRRQRATLRENRRKETRERRRAEKARSESKGKDKDKVRFSFSPFSFYVLNLLLSL